MHESGKKLLNLMFKEGETICVSKNTYGFHSIPLDVALSDEVTLVSPNPKINTEKIDSNELTLVALNPIKGWRRDEFCTSFRNFLIEMDTGSLEHQYKYIKELGMPYSAVVFSGNKSLHYLISLEEDLPSEKVYRTLIEWTLKIIPLADQNTINPSRSIRIPGPKRGEKHQALVEYKGRVSISDLSEWLLKYPHLKPRPHVKREISSEFNFYKISKWTKDLLINGLDPGKGRNVQWFSIACEFAQCGYSEENTIDILADFFSPENDFKEREWLTAIKSGHKYIKDKA